jgi:hypothetical protein
VLIRLFRLADEGGDLGPELLPAGAFTGGQGGRGLLVADSGEVGVLLPL